MVLEPSLLRVIVYSVNFTEQVSEAKRIQNFLTQGTLVNWVWRPSISNSLSLLY